MEMEERGPGPHGAPVDGLGREESRFRRLAAGLPVGIVVQGLRGEILYANRAALAMLGLVEEHLEGPGPLEAGLVTRDDGRPFPPEDFPIARALLTALPVRGVLMGVYRPAVKDQVWLVASADPELDEVGNVRQVVTTFTEVTALKRTGERAREKDAPFRELVELAADAVYRTDAEGVFTYANPAAARLTGYAEAELLGRHFSELVREDHRERVTAALVRQSRECTANTYDELVLLTRDGREVWVGQNVQILRDGSRVRGFQAVARDVTSRRAKVPAEERKSVAPAISEDAPQVLVVDDNAVNLKVIAAMLQSLGYRVDTAPDGLAAVEACSLRAYAAILMDCQMPEMDGFRATAWIRQREGTGRRTPIIALTGSVLPGDREKCLAAGMDDFLAKPVGLKTLDGALKRWTSPVTSTHPPPPGSWAAGLPADHPLRVLESQGRSAVAAEILDLFLQTTPLRLEGMRDARASGDLPALPALAHNLKGAAFQIGARGLAELCVRLQAAARTSDGAEAGRLLEALEAEHLSLARLLEDERARLAVGSPPSTP